MNGKLLAALIALSGLSDTEIAARLGISRGAYYRRIRKETEFTRVEIATFSDILDTPEIKALLAELAALKSARDIFFWDERNQKVTQEA